MTVTGWAAVAAATERVSSLSTCGAAAASGGDPCPVSAAMSLVSADSTPPPPCPFLTHGKSVLLPRCSVQKAKFNFPGITEEPEPALTA